VDNGGVRPVDVHAGPVVLLQHHPALAQTQGHASHRQPGARARARDAAQASSQSGRRLRPLPRSSSGSKPSIPVRPCCSTRSSRSQCHSKSSSGGTEADLPSCPQRLCRRVFPSRRIHPRCHILPVRGAPALTQRAKASKDGVPLPFDEWLCPLCLGPRTNAAASPDGYAFCFKCIEDYVQEHRACPITQMPCTKASIRKIYDDGAP
jgi:hypothetical protein